jgi:hypothetical protein
MSCIGTELVQSLANKPQAVAKTLLLRGLYKPRQWLKEGKKERKTGSKNNAHLACTFSHADDTVALALQDAVHMLCKLGQRESDLWDEADVNDARRHAGLHGDEA